MLEPDRDEVVQALASQRLDPPLHVRVAERGPDGQRLALDPLLGELGVELSAELPVIVADHDGRLGQPSFLDLARQARGGVGRPASRGPEGRLGDDDPAALHVDEGEHRGGPQPAAGQHLGGEEVAGPQRLGVTLEEGLPGGVPSLRRGLDPVAFEDVAHGRVRDGLDAQLAQLAEDPGVTPARLTREPDDQLLDMSCRPRPARRPLRLAALPLHPPRPASEGVVPDDRNEVLEAPAPRPSRTGPACPAPARSAGPGRRSGREQAVLDHEVFDLPGQRRVVGLDQPEQEWKQALHPPSVARVLGRNQRAGVFAHRPGGPGTASGPPTDVGLRPTPAGDGPTSATMRRRDPVNTNPAIPEVKRTS